MTNAFTPYNGQADNFAATLFQTPSGIALVGQSATFTGDTDAASTFDNLLLGKALIQHGGILLTSGDGTPPLSNGQASYGQSNGAAGDSDLTDIVEAAFPGAGATQDATVLEFQINADPGVKTIMMDVVFGSDEFPEFSNTSYVDIAAIIVNGKNVALFQGNSKKPLSILDDNLGYFQDNAAGGITIEYDGVSNKLTVIAKVNTGVNDIKIAIADTGDSIYDSAIFVSNIRGSDKDLEGILNEVSGTDGKDNLKAIAGIDNVVVGGLGPDKIAANTGFDILYGDEQDNGSSFTKSVDTISAGDDFKDKFIFKSSNVLEKKLSKTDVIADLDDLDRIDISKMAGHKFDFIGKKDFSDHGDPEVRYTKFKNDDYTAVYIDKNGDGKVDASIKILGLHNLTGDDFFL